MNEMDVTSTPRPGKKSSALTALDRRSFVLTAIAGAASLTPILALAETPNTGRTQAFEDAWRQLLLDTKPAAERVTLELPELAENGNFVPVKISVESPMTEADYVKAIHILSTGNPQPKVATFRLSPANGTAIVQSRMRLSGTQDVIAVAEFSNGEFAMSTVNVKVTIGGCSN